MKTARFALCLAAAVGTATAALGDEVPYHSQDEALRRAIDGFTEAPLQEIELPAISQQAKARSPKENFLKPDHPRHQPVVAMSTWRSYAGVPNDGGTAAVPQQSRADSGFPEGANIRFRSLPDVAPGDTLKVTYQRTPRGIFPKVDPFRHPPGTNMLPTVQSDMINQKGEPIPNTLPSTKKTPYNLHDGEPRVTRINPESPIEDLRYILENAYEIFVGKPYNALFEKLDASGNDALQEFLEQPQSRLGEIKDNAKLLHHLLQWGIDIVEGNDDQNSRVPGDRAYRGFPLLNHSGHKRVRCVEPVYDETGTIVGGQVDVRQLWYGGRIQSDAMFYDFGWANNGKGGEAPRRCDSGKDPAPIPPNVPWIMTYTVDVLNGSRDDFSPTAMYFDCPKKLGLKTKGEDEVIALPSSCPPPDRAQPIGKYKWEKGDTGVAMDQSFFPMEAGTRTVVKIKMAPPMYYKLTYTWGWRQHPPRAQAVENAHQGAPPQEDRKKNLVAWERDVFGEVPLRSILMLSDLAPAKRMWRAFGGALSDLHRLNEEPEGNRIALESALQHILDARDAYLDWLDRTKLPSGIKTDPKSDLTVLFVNNTIYGEFKQGGLQFQPWRTRLATDGERPCIGDPDNCNKLRVTLINGDYFAHGYMNVDFGGLRGWENQFKSSIKVAGSGPFFTFGRFFHRPNVAPGSVGMPPAQAFYDASRSRALFGGDGSPLLADGMPFEAAAAGLRLDAMAEAFPQRTLDFSEPPQRALFDRLAPPAVVTPQVHRLMIEYNFEPSRRLRFYQFDPLHHDVAIFSVH